MLTASRHYTLHISEPEANIPELEATLPVRDSLAADSDHVDHVLAQWASERPDLNLAPVALIARLGRATAYIDAGVNPRLAEFGLTRGTWDVLASLRRSGTPHRLSPTQLYLELMRTSGAMTHRLSGLERAGLIKRIPDPEDGRGLLVELTRKGIAIVDQVAPAHLANERALLAALSEEEQTTLVNLLRRLLTAFEREDPVPPLTGRGGRHKPHRPGARRAF
jgi:DNA-binding MarR family transcriptional regulator